MKIKRLYSSVIFVLLCALPAHAHRSGIPVTTLEWNERTSVWEVTHRLSAHDVDDTLGQTVLPADVDATTLSEIMKDYVDSNFHIVGIVRLSFIGAETVGDDIYVYYELSGFDQTVAVYNRLLLETVSTHTALLNVKRADVWKSYTFDNTSGWIAFTLNRPADAIGN